MLASPYARRACAAEKREDDASPVPGGGPGPDGGEARAGLGAGGEARAGLADLGASGEAGGGAGGAGGRAGRTSSRLADLIAQARRIGWREAEEDLRLERRMQFVLGSPRMQLASKPGRDLPRPVSPPIWVRREVPADLELARLNEANLRNDLLELYDDWLEANEECRSLERKVFDGRLDQLDAVQARIGDSAEEYLRRHNALDKADFDSKEAKRLRLAAKAERNEKARLDLCVELARLQEAARATPSASAPPADGEAGAGGAGAPPADGEGGEGGEGGAGGPA